MFVLSIGNVYVFKKWVNAFQEHIAYSTHYISQGVSYVDSDEEDTPDVLKLTSLQDVLHVIIVHLDCYSF